MPASPPLATPSPASAPLAPSPLLAADELMLPVPTVTIYPGDTIKETMLRLQAYPKTYRARAAVIDAPLAIVGRTA
ncbi:MAG: flagella basal body P-ring formation protein FlgA, partial [Parafilimonas terrae]|nr:flagella basal body P-ring formation protein FlgA [Parafilimonas terrae]